MQVFTEAVVTAGGKRQKLPSNDAERHKGSGEKALAASSAEVWKYKAIKTNGICETRGFWTGRCCVEQINKSRA